MTKDPIDMGFASVFRTIAQWTSKIGLKCVADSQIWSSVQLFKESPILKS